MLKPLQYLSAAIIGAGSSILFPSLVFAHPPGRPLNTPLTLEQQSSLHFLHTLSPILLIQIIGVFLVVICFVLALIKSRTPKAKKKQQSRTLLQSRYAQVAILLLLISVLPSTLTLIQNQQVSNTNAAAPGTLTVDATQPVHPFTNHMLGIDFVNWEHSWGKPFPGSVPGLAQAMQAAHIGLIRYAGGNWANSVGFNGQVQITPYTEWHSTTDPNDSYWFSYGTDELASLAQLEQATGADVMIQVNISNNDPQMWANMVRYTNITHNWHFKYWELGNELDADSSMTADIYASRMKAYQAAMLAVDPTIQIIGPAVAGAIPQTGSNTALSPYLTTPPTIAHNGGHDLAALTYHWYQACNTTNQLQDALRYRWYNSDGTPIDPNVWNNAYSRYYADMLPPRIRSEALSNFPNMQIGVTELNVDACNYDNVINGNHINALWFSDVLGRLGYNGVDFATMFEGYGSQGYSMFYPNDDNSPTRIDIRPSYYAYLMYGQYFGDELVKSSSYKNDDISIWASTDSKDPGKLKLRITNFTDQAITTPVQLTGFSTNGGSVYILQSTNPTDMSATSNTTNAPTTINGVTINGMNVATGLAQIQPIALSASGTQFTYTFPAYSTTAVILNQGSATTSPTPSVSPTVTPTPSNSPTPTPTLIPSPTPTTPGSTGPTIGLNSIGKTQDTGDANYMNGSKITIGSTGVHVSQLSAYLETIDAAPFNQYQMAIYTDTNGAPNSLVAKTAPGTLQANAWNSLPISADLSANTSYWLMYNTNGNNNLYFNAVSSPLGAYDTTGQVFGTFPSTFGLASGGDWQFSLYATVASTTGVTTIPSPTPTSTPSPTPTVSVTGAHGITGTYFANRSLTSPSAFTRVDNQLNFNWGSKSPVVGFPKDNFSVRWTGKLLPATSQTYTIYTTSDDGIRVWVNNQLVINDWTDHSAKTDIGKISLTSGVAVPITVEFYEHTGQAEAKLFWSTPTITKQIIPNSALLPF